jgi:hypothetical protein
VLASKLLKFTHEISVIAFCVNAVRKLLSIDSRDAGLISHRIRKSSVVGSDSDWFVRLRDHDHEAELFLPGFSDVHLPKLYDVIVIPEMDREHVPSCL